MPDVLTRLRVYGDHLEEIAPEITMADLTSSERAGNPEQQRPRRRPALVAMAAVALIVALIGGALIVFSGDDSQPVITTPSPTTVSAPTTTIPSPPTTLPAVVPATSTPVDEVPVIDQGRVAAERDLVVGAILETTEALDISIGYVSSDSFFADRPGELAAATSVSDLENDPSGLNDYVFEVIAFRSSAQASAHLARESTAAVADAEPVDFELPDPPAIGDESAVALRCGVYVRLSAPNASTCIAEFLARQGRFVVHLHHDDPTELEILADAVFNALETSYSPTVLATEGESFEAQGVELTINAGNQPLDDLPVLEWRSRRGLYPAEGEAGCGVEISRTDVGDRTANSYDVWVDGTVERLSDEPSTNNPSGVPVPPEDPGHALALDLCTRYPSPSVADIGLTGVVATYPAGAELHDLVPTDTGEYAATASSWYYTLGRAEAVEIGLIGETDDIDVDRFVLWVNANKTQIRSLRLAAVGPAGTIARVFDVDLTQLDQQQPVEVDFSINVD